ncbi:formylglycine-generating enzyme family protein [uncultured Cyclobacterium sp.]|uniref:formylglycine-generating enzyme family protein n=1 Tax=uncultured Cyclobacterium sp. TaxID=453820 RepID=UPI0030EBA621|tara:strand:- start:33929 stop:34693 length:765 start_codon:yes stop_codon:yes gene_type:complete
MKNWVLIGALALIHFSTFGQENAMRKIDGGTYLPLYGNSNEKVNVSAFYIDPLPVTHEAYLEFVIEYPEWQKSKVKGLFADKRYLEIWEGDLSYPLVLKNSPVIQVSWFAAKAYCACQGKRLPTVDEWEYVAMANEVKEDARGDSLYNLAILRSYETPKTYLLSVGSQASNVYGVYDLHGLVWEWTLDFNSIIITGESRNNGNTDQGLFCASGALGANDLMNYAAFMRYAMRSSLKARYSMSNLGFRCAKDIEQ